MAWEQKLDHAIPVSDPVDGERLALEPSNFRASHALHNRLRAAGGGAVADVRGGDDGERESWPTAVIDGVEGRYNPELGVPSEWW